MRPKPPMKEKIMTEILPILILFAVFTLLNKM